MSELISMVDFVLNIPMSGMEVQSIGIQGNNRYQKCIRYAKFIKQPLTLGMFVPCKLVDGICIVLENPDPKNKKYRMIVGEENENILDLYSFDCDLKEYQEAKERCLFEGFEFEHTSVVKYDNYIFSIKDKNIESLIRIHCLPKLTASALKQIGYE